MVIRNLSQSGGATTRRPAGAAVCSWLVACCLLLLAAVASAHDDRPAPVVGIRVVPTGSNLDVTVTLPSRTLADPTLPRDDQGRLIGSGIDEALRLIARDMVNGLELRQAGEPLPSPALSVATADDGAAVRIALGYLIRPGTGRLSMRAAPYRGQLDLVPVDVTFEESSSNVRRYRVARVPERINLQPTAADTALEFVTRGARLLTARWELMLFVLLISLPAGLERHIVRRDLPLLLLSQTAGLAAGTAGLVTAAWSVPVLAASILLVAVIHRLVVSVGSDAGRRSAFVPFAFTGAFGLAAGAAIGVALGDSLPFAGNHAALGLVVAIGVILLGQWWLSSLCGVVVRLALRYGLSEGMVLASGAILIGHEAMHAVALHAMPASQQLGLSRDHLIEMLTLLWIAALFVGSLLQRRVRA